MKNNSASITLQPPFHDVDMYGVVWHGHYYKYFEAARMELFRSMGLDLEQFDELGLMVPIVDCGCRFLSPLRYTQPVVVSATLTEWETRLRVEYEIWNEKRDKKLARGYTVQVLIDNKRGEIQFPIPDSIKEHILKGTGSAQV